MRQKPCISVQLERDVELTSVFIGCPLIHDWLAEQENRNLSLFFFFFRLWEAAPAFSDVMFR